MNQHVKVRESCGEIGRLARQVLSGNWIKAALAGIVFVLSYVLFIAAVFTVLEVIAIPFDENSLIVDILAVVLIIVAVCALFPVTLGYYSFFLSICRGQGSSPLIVVKGFGNSGRAIGAGLLTATLTFIAFIVGGLLLFPFLRTVLFDYPEGFVNFIVFCILCIAILFIPFCIYLLFSMTFLIIANQPSIGCFQAISESARLMRGNMLKRFSLHIHLGAITVMIRAPGLLIMKFLYGSQNYIYLYTPDLGTLYEVLFIVINLMEAVLYVAWVSYAMACETVFYEIASGHLRAEVNSWEPVERQSQGSMAYGNQGHADGGFRQEEFEPARETMGSINFNYNIDNPGGEPLLTEQQESETNNTIDTVNIINQDLSESIGQEQAAPKPVAIMGLDRAVREEPAIKEDPAEGLIQKASSVDEKVDKNIDKNADGKKAEMPEHIREEEEITGTRKIIREMIESGDSSLESFIRRWEEKNHRVLH